MGRMAIDDLDLVDDALILSGLVDVLGLLPTLGTRADEERRQRMIRTCRTAATQVAAQSGSDQRFEDAKAYAGDEWRNELLLALLGPDEAQRLLTRV